MTTSPHLPPRPHVAALVTQQEFARLDGTLRETLELRFVRHPNHVRALFLKAAASGWVVSLRALETPAMRSAATELARQFPSFQSTGLVAAQAPDLKVVEAHRLGLIGCTAIVDLWNGYHTKLRSLFDTVADPFPARAVVALTSPNASPGWLRYLMLLFNPRCRTSARAGREIGVHASTLVSRFWRAGLPSPKTYLTHARLALAAHYFETPGHSVTTVAQLLGASSAQSFGRTVKRQTGLTAMEFRAVHTGESYLAQIRKHLIDPYAERLTSFDPTSDTVGVTRGKRSQGIRAAA